MSVPQALLVGVVLLALNAFFVGAEFAVVSARRSRVEPLAESGRRAARTTLWAMEHVSLMLACAQLGITVASLGLGAVAEPALAGLLEPAFARAGLPEGLVHPVAFALALTVVVYLHVVVGEMVPKNLALAAPERVALVLAPPLVAVARAVSPVIRLLSAVTGVLLRVVGVTPRTELTSAFTAQEMHSIVAASRREGLLGDAHDLLTGVLELGERQAVSVMVPLERLVTVPAGSSPAEVERLVARTGFSRFPVAAGPGVTTVPVTTPHAGYSAEITVRERPGRGADAADGAGTGVGPIVGYLHVKDLLYADDGRHDEPVPAKRVRSLVAVSPLDHVEDVLSAMQRTGSHLARVVGADGETVGVLFLEDVIEELVGEVRDATQRRNLQVKGL